MSPIQAGHLYIVATPIGNLGDLSPRAIATLKAVDLICAEDTRTSGQLLTHFGLKRPLTALHEHNEDGITPKLIHALQSGQSIALISDAGTPLISDPGFVLVREARQHGIPVLAVPGACAAIAALSISGLASNSFTFIGFLPAKSQARQQRIAELANAPRTLIFYESSHRISDSLTDMHTVLGPQRKICVARELTKRFEESYSGNIADALAWITGHAHRQKGEFVIILEPAPKQDEDAEQADRVLTVLLKELSASRATKLAVELTGLRKQFLYQRALALSAENHSN